MGRKPCCEKEGRKRGPWSPEEDKKLVAYVEEHGHGNWRSLPLKAGLQRCGKSCRLRWINYLKPDIKRGNFSLEEDRTIIQLHALLGNKWSIIAAHLHKRTDNEIKNYWHSHIKQRLIKMGIDPTTHKPIKATNTTGHDQSKDVAIVSHMTQWESTRLEAEARESMLQLGSCSSSHPARLIISKIPPRPSPPPCLDVLKAWQISRSSDQTPSSTKHNNTMYNMYAIMLAMDDLQSPVSTLSFPGCKLPMSSNNVGKFTNSSLSYEGDCNVIEASSDKVKEGIESSSQDDDIMEAFRAARRENVPELANVVIEGLNKDMPCCDSWETFAEEYGYGNINLEANFHYWNCSLLDSDNYSPCHE